jgi:hypothetical protein
LLWGLMSLELWHQRFIDSPAIVSVEPGLEPAIP